MQLAASPAPARWFAVAHADTLPYLSIVPVWYLVLYRARIVDCGKGLCIKHLRRPRALLSSASQGAWL